MNKFIAFHYLKVFYDSRIKRFCLITEMLFHQQGKLLHGFGSIDLRPDKSSHFIKMNLGNIGGVVLMIIMILSLLKFSIWRKKKA